MQVRLFIMGAVVATMALIGASPAIAAKPIVLKLESPVPRTSVIFENFQMYADLVEKMSGGRSGRLMDAMAERCFASALELDAGSILP